MRQPDESKLRF
jgi:vacuolar protein-sorting-associated protein 4